MNFIYCFKVIVINLLLFMPLIASPLEAENQEEAKNYKIFSYQDFALKVKKIADKHPDRSIVVLHDLDETVTSLNGCNAVLREWHTQHYINVLCTIPNVFFMFVTAKMGSVAQEETTSFDQKKQEFFKNYVPQAEKDLGLRVSQQPYCKDVSCFVHASSPAYFERGYFFTSADKGNAVLSLLTSSPLQHLSGGIFFFIDDLEERVENVENSFSLFAPASDLYSFWYPVRNPNDAGALLKEEASINYLHAYFRHGCIKKIQELMNKHETLAEEMKEHKAPFILDALLAGRAMTEYTFNLLEASFQDLPPQAREYLVDSILSDPDMIVEQEILNGLCLGWEDWDENTKHLLRVRKKKLIRDGNDKKAIVFIQALGGGAVLDRIDKYNIILAPWPQNNNVSLEELSPDDFFKQCVDLCILTADDIPLLQRSTDIAHASQQPYALKRLDYINAKTKPKEANPQKDEVAQ